MHQSIDSWYDYEDIDENKELFRRLLNAVYLRKKYTASKTNHTFTRYFYNKGIFNIVIDRNSVAEKDDITEFLQNYNNHDQIYLSHTNLSMQIDSLSVGLAKKENMPVGQEGAQPIIPIEEYYSDCNYVLSICNNRPIKSLTYRRLEHLKHSFNMYRNVVAGREKREQQKWSKRDFYTVHKVDNHIHHSAAINCKHLLKFIKRKLRNCPDDIVYEKEGRLLTLREVFTSLNITIDELRIENIDTHSHTDTFHRFDRFNNKYNLLGQSILREIFLKYDNFIDGRYLAELTKELISHYKESKYQHAELRISVYGKDSNEFFKLAHWIESNKLYSRHIKWIVQIPRLFPTLKKKYGIASFGDMLRNIFEPLFRATVFAAEKGETYMCNKPYADRYRGIYRSYSYKHDCDKRTSIDKHMDIDRHTGIDILQDEGQDGECQGDKRMTRSAMADNAGLTSKSEDVIAGTNKDVSAGQPSNISRPAPSGSDIPTENASVGQPSNISRSASSVSTVNDGKYSEDYKISLICNFLRNMGGFDTVDDESLRERKYHHKFPMPDEWTHNENPPYSYYIYFLYSNIKMLNLFRKSRKLNTFKFMPHSGETGDFEHLVNTFLTADGICHGVQLRKCFPLTYLFYICQIELTMSPLSNNSLFITLDKNPFFNFFNIGLNLSLSTDDPLHFHFTRDPLMEEYSVVTQLYKLSSVDQCELARNSVIHSNFSFEWKKEVIGDFYKEGTEGNSIAKTNVPNIRVHYRWITLYKERKLIGYSLSM